MVDHDSNENQDARRQEEIHQWRGLFEVAERTAEKYSTPGPLDHVKIGPLGSNRIRVLLVFQSSEDVERCAQSGQTQAMKDYVIEQLRQAGRGTEEITIQADIEQNLFREIRRDQQGPA